MQRRDFLGGAARLALAAAASRWVTPARASDSQRVTLAAVGDCLLTRGFVRNDPGLQPLLSILRGADVAFGNLEVTLPNPDMYPAATGACGDLNNSAEGPLAEELKWAGFKILSLANNHSLDYGPAGMLATLEKVSATGIAHAGTGRNLEDARPPAYYDSPAGRVALVACASTLRPGSYASSGNGEIPGRPGLSPLRVSTTYRVEGSQIEALRKIQEDLFPGGRRWLVEPVRSEGLNFLDHHFVAGSPPDVMTSPDPRDLAEIVASVRRARRNAGCVLVSIHAHEGHRNLEEPATFLPEFAHACVDAGASAFVGHGPHVLRGIEIYKGRPIFYSLGNFIFVAEGMRQIPKEIFETCGISGNDPSDFFDKAMPGFADAAYWESVVARVGFERGELREIKLYPIVLQQELPRAERGMPVRANAAQSRTILGRLAKLSEPFGTRLGQEGDVGIVRI